MASTGRQANALPQRHGAVLPLISGPSAKAGCPGCRQDPGLSLAFTMAFQPIVHLASRAVFAHEALVRGPAEESAASILARVDAENKYRFDQAARIRAIEMASALSPAGRPARVSINFIPGAVYEPRNCIRRTLETATRVGTPLSHIIFEVTESERVEDRDHLLGIFREYRRSGLWTAIDDFGAGHAGLTLLAAFQPEIVKLDMELIRNIDTRPPARRIVQSIVEVCRDLGIQVIAEGIETTSECSAVVDLGIALFQGLLFARPAFESFAQPAFPDLG